MIDTYVNSSDYKKTKFNARNSLSLFITQQLTKKTQLLKVHLLHLNKNYY